MDVFQEILVEIWNLLLQKISATLALTPDFSDTSLIHAGEQWTIC